MTHGCVRKYVALWTAKWEYVIRNDVPKLHQLCAFLGMLLGIVTIFVTQSMMKEYVDPINRVCQSSIRGEREQQMHELKLHPHEPWLGGNFICVMTQLVHELIKHPGGVFIWGVLSTFNIVTAMVMNFEADRVYYLQQKKKKMLD